MKNKPHHLSTTVKFFLTVIATISLTRIVLLILFHVLFAYTKYLDRIIEDSFHHYYAGILLFLLSALVKRKSKRLVIWSVAFGLIIEEHAVVLSDIGISRPGYFYLSGTDLLAAFGITILLYGLVRMIQQRIKNRW